ncbi:MAG: MgtC/SapB family protein [Pseudolabrys sp.]
MPLDVTWLDLLVRLGSTLLAGAIIGYNRGEHGKAAGLRTTLLVSLAAAIAMLQVNYLLTLAGRHPDSFVMNDLMRLPLGILTGVGFIGAGAILRRRDLVIGVTTAATLWYVTVLGLCFGGGQMLLGWVGTAIGCAVLWCLKWLELSMKTEFRHRLTMTVENAALAESDIRRQLQDGGLTVAKFDVAREGQRRNYAYDVIHLRSSSNPQIPAVIDALMQQPGISAVHWNEVG